MEMNFLPFRKLVADKRSAEFEFSFIKMHKKKSTVCHKQNGNSSHGSEHWAHLRWPFECLHSISVFILQINHYLVFSRWNKMQENRKMKCKHRTLSVSSVAGNQHFRLRHETVNVNRSKRKFLSAAITLMTKFLKPQWKPITEIPNMERSFSAMIWWDYKNTI